MATVRMSARLRGEILDNAMSDYEKTVNNADKERIELDTIIGGNWRDCKVMQDGRALEAAIVNLISTNPSPQMRSFIDKTVEQTCTISEVSVRVNIPQSQPGRYSTITHKYTLKEREALRGAVCSMGVTDWKTLNLSPLSFGDKAERIEELILARANRQDEEREKKSNFRKGVRDLLEQCNTVKQLLTAWPAASKLLPPATVQKMHEKVERRFDADAAKARANFDPSQANTTILTAALLGDIE